MKEWYRGGAFDTAAAHTQQPCRKASGREGRCQDEDRRHRRRARHVERARRGRRLWPVPEGGVDAWPVIQMIREILEGQRQPPAGHQGCACAWRTSRPTSTRLPRPKKAKVAATSSRAPPPEGPSVGLPARLVICNRQDTTAERQATRVHHLGIATRGHSAACHVTLAVRGRVADPYDPNYQSSEITWALYECHFLVQHKL